MPEGRARIVKRSLVIAGHRTSVSLEDAFWRRLQTIAAERGVSVNGLAADIDAARGEANLSSALRVFVLETLHSFPITASTCSSGAGDARKAPK